MDDHVRSVPRTHVNAASAHAHPAHPDRRPALDGIRAIAVIAVLAYHLGVPLPGGFLGVDVFFVLSGYLITGLLLQERARTGRIALGAFWVRRARRLLPAALLLLIVCALVTSRLASVASLPARRSDMLATLFYYANWNFIASDQSYFANFTGVSPLRHTWSLAIEEQFYLLWPLALIALLFMTRRARAALPAVLGVLAIGSAVLMAAAFDPIDPARAYYGTETRMHSLLVGAALGVLVHRHPMLLATARARSLARGASVLIAFAFVIAVLAIGDHTSFYYRGGSLLFAVAVAIGIWAVEARPRDGVATTLSASPLVWIGHVSYGLYLWHWPLLVWVDSADTFEGWSTNARHGLVLIATFVIASASYYLVEQPIRRGAVPWVRMHARRLVGVATACIMISALTVVQTTDISSSAVVNQVTDTSDTPCPPDSPIVDAVFAWCVRTTPASARAPVVAVAGDSTSRALDPGMQHLAGKRGWGYIQAGQNGCSATAELLAGSTDPAELEVRRTCPAHVPALLADVNAKADPDVWIVMDWTTLGTLVRPDGTVMTLEDPRRAEVLVPSMQEMLRALTANGAAVVYVATPPNGEPVECTTDAPPETCGTTFHSMAYPPIRLLHDIEREATAGVPGVTYISVNDVLCPGTGHCPAVIDGVLARSDGVHYTGTFSRTIVKIIVTRAKKAGVRFRGDGEVSAAAR